MFTIAAGILIAVFVLANLDAVLAALGFALLAALALAALAGGGLAIASAEPSWSTVAATLAVIGGFTGFIWLCVKSHDPRYDIRPEVRDKAGR